MNENEFELEVELAADQLDCEMELAIDVHEIETEIPAAITVTQLIQDVTEIDLVSGDIDGNNKDFEFAAPPLFIFWQGQKLVEGATVNGYTLNGSTATLTEAPMPGDHVEAYGYN